MAIIANRPGYRGGEPLTTDLIDTAKSIGMLGGIGLVGYGGLKGIDKITSLKDLKAQNQLASQLRNASRVARGRSPVVVAAEELKALKAGTASPVRAFPPTAGPAIPAGPIGSTSLGPIPTGPIPGNFPGGLPASEISKIRGIGGQISSELGAGQNVGSVLSSRTAPSYYPGAYSPAQVNAIRASGELAGREAAALRGFNPAGTLARGVPTTPYGATTGINMAGATPYNPSAMQAANAVDDPIAAFLREEAARRSGAGAAGESVSLLSRLGFGGQGAAGTSGINQFIRAGLTPKAALGRVLGGAGLGYTAAQYVTDPLNIGGKNSALDRFATGATFGAGLGAGIGNVIPIPGVGAAIGAGVGALTFGTANTIKGWFDDKGMTEVSAKNRDRYAGLTGLMDTAGLTQRQRQALMSQYETQMKLVGDDTKSQTLLLDNLEQQVVGLAGSNPYQVTGQDLIGLQAQIQDYMRPLQERMSASSSGLAAAYSNIASQMQSPQLADAMRLQGSNVQAAADRQILANAATAANLPAAYSLQMQNMTRSQTPASNDLLANAGG